MQSNVNTTKIKISILPENGTNLCQTDMHSCNLIDNAMEMTHEKEL